MRDIERIEPFLQEIGKLWKQVPDWRFGQLMSNVLNSLPQDPFHYEDKEMLEEFDKYFKK